jgi:3-methylcrotonyl-CoA carboxylase alpha subunit
MFKKILIANRGEIATRIIKTARRLGTTCIAVYSDADRDALHVAMADEAYRLGPPPASKSYLNISAIIEAARKSGAQAIHPGYGFLSENPEFVEACEAAGIVFIGPPAGAIRAMGLKDAAKRLMERAGIPVVPGYHGDKQEPNILAAKAGEIGYPVLIKARAGGGGKGMRLVEDPIRFKAALESAQREATSSFGDGRVLIEKYLTKPRHIEVQIFADAYGSVVHLFERDCSLQRRHQKVIEEAPAPGMTEEMRAAMGRAAAKAALAVGYCGAGTVEFIVDASQGLRLDRFFFMEMNTRLQVEHPVTEEITGQDLVAWQLCVAAGEPLPVSQDELKISGHAFEARVYAEDAERNFMPATGRLTHLYLPEDEARIDTGVRQGDEISPFYDPMIAKVIVHAPNRAAALNKLSRALARSRAVGCVTNFGFLEALTREPSVVAGDVDTGLIERELSRLVVEGGPSLTSLVIAALASLGVLREKQGIDPWCALVGWRLWTEARQFALLEWRGETIEVRVNSRGHAAYEVDTPKGKVTLALKSVNCGLARFDCNDRVLEAVIVEGKSQVSVFMGGEAHTFDLADRLSDVTEEASGEDNVVSPLPGLIKMVNVRAGDKVNKGEPLIVVEAMKMEHIMAAPRDGEVAEVLVAVNDQVQDGTMLLRLSMDGCN